MPRPVSRPWAACSSSDALRRPISGVVVTSMPRRRSPSAIARWQSSSRWKRIVRGIGLPLPELLLDEGRARLGPHVRDETLTRADVVVDLLPVFIVVGE